MKITCIVEGHGEVKAAPVLLRRTLLEKFSIDYVEIIAQRRHGINALEASNWANFKRFLAAAYYENAPILWMLDADDFCPCEKLPSLYSAAQEIRVQQPLGFCFWHREFETLFLYDTNALAKTLRCKPFASPESPQSIRDAKKWVSSHFPNNSAYKETLHQAKVTSHLDFDFLCAHYNDFQHYIKVVEWLISSREPSIYPLTI
ncbi:MAG: DUF4276 family protein [Algiphilus sp.]